MHDIHEEGFLDVVRKGAIDLVDMGKWVHYENYRKNAEWFFDFVLPEAPNDPRTIDEDVDPENILAKRYIRELTALIAESTYQQREPSFTEQPRKPRDGVQFGFAVPKVEAMAKALREEAEAVRP